MATQSLGFQAPSLGVPRSQSTSLGPVECQTQVLDFKPQVWSLITKSQNSIPVPRHFNIWVSSVESQSAPSTPPQIIEHQCQPGASVPSLRITCQTQARGLKAQPERGRLHDLSPFFLKQEVLKAPFAWSVKLGATVSGSSLSQTFRITTLGFHTPELLALGPDPNEHRERAKHDYNAIVYVIGILLQHDFNLLITSTLPFNWAYMMMQCF